MKKNILGNNILIKKSSMKKIETSPIPSKNKKNKFNFFTLSSKDKDISSSPSFSTLKRSTGNF